MPLVPVPVTNDLARFPDWQTGLYYDVRQSFGGTSSAAALTANTLYASPLWVPRAGMAVDRIGINVTVAGTAGKLARLMVYYATADALPGDLLLDAGTVAVDTTGAKEITIALTLPQGLLFTAVVSDGAPTITTFANPAFSYGGASLSGTNARLSPNRAFTFAAAPDPFGTVTGFMADNYVRVSLRAV